MNKAINFASLLENGTDLTGFRFQKGFVAVAYQGRYDYANARDLLWREENSIPVISLSQRLLKKLAKVVPKPNDGEKKRWRIRIHEVLVLVAPNGKILRSLQDSFDEPQEPLKSGDSPNLYWAPLPF